jgi:hypothetical protein
MMNNVFRIARKRRSGRGASEGWRERRRGHEMIVVQVFWLEKHFEKLVEKRCGEGKECSRKGARTRRAITLALPL